MQLPVITFHDIVNAENFAKQVAYLRANYTFVTPEEVVNGIEQRAQLPSNALLLTFDDAYPSVYEKAFPILLKYELPATIFVITGLVGTDNPYWWDEVEYYAPSDWTPRQKNKQVWQVKEWTNADRLAYLSQLRSASTQPALTRKQLTWEQLKEMEEGGICIANHTHDHPLLNRCTEGEIRETVRIARDQLTERGLSGGKFFAYPNGNNSQVTERILAEEGMQLAFYFDHQLNRHLPSPLRISRLSMNTRNSIPKTRLILSGLHSRYLSLKKRIVN